MKVSMMFTNLYVKNERIEEVHGRCLLTFIKKRTSRKARRSSSLPYFRIKDLPQPVENKVTFHNSVISIALAGPNC